jgi:hypothetical protein
MERVEERAGVPPHHRTTTTEFGFEGCQGVDHRRP